ncbi:MAG TPA: dienelactone hydrolase family protein [Methylomirabilota bacterium]|nr:dienelactone hydrolase family protein [Methylomirabilota bacterium]
MERCSFLSSFPPIDPARIGITGFSLGGAVSMLTASKPLADQYGPPGLRFRAHASLYPVCWVYNSSQRPHYIFKELTGAPVLIQGGALDTYDEPDTCQKLVNSLPDASRQLVRLKMYPGATHKFDAAEPGHVFKDPAANLGRGGEVRVVPNPAAAEMAREATARCFVEVLGLGQ